MSEEGKDKPARARRPVKPGMARRSGARLAATQALYQIAMVQTGTEDVVQEFLKHRLGQEIEGEHVPEADPQLFANIVRGANSRREDVDALLNGALDPAWPTTRLETPLLAVLRAGAYELMAHHDTPAKVLINEYVDVARAFYAGREPGMVNGVMDRVARRLRPEEFEGGGAG